MASLLATRLCGTSQLRLTISRFVPKRSFIRNYSKDGDRDFVEKTARRKTLRDRAMAPTEGTPFSIGAGAVAGGAAVGLGALCFYGLGMSSEAGALEKSSIWPDYVKERIRTTYSYFGGSLVVTSAAAMAAFSNKALLRAVSSGGPMAIFLSIAAMMGTGILAQSIEYKPGFGAKQMAWMLHSATMGVMLAPLCFLGGPVLIRAAWYTAGIVGGLSTIAVCAPSEKFLMMGGPLAMGLGVVFVSSLGSAFLPPTTALGAGLYAVSLYGGLLLFSGFLLYDTQRIIYLAERHPTTPTMYGARPFDPINAALSIYMDTINIFIRVVTILAGGGGNRKR